MTTLRHTAFRNSSRNASERAAVQRDRGDISPGESEVGAEQGVEAESLSARSSGLDGGDDGRLDREGVDEQSIRPKARPEQLDRRQGSVFGETENETCNLSHPLA